MIKFPKPAKEKSFLLRAVVLSLFLHLFFTYVLNRNSSPLEKKDPKKKPIKVKIVRRDPIKRIIETRQNKTAPPKKPKYHGRNDHIAKREQIAQTKPVPTVGEAEQKTKQGTTLEKKNQKKPKETKRDIVKKPSQKKSLFKRSLDLARKESLRTYQETVDDKLPKGEVLDLSTSDYRYIGYFIGLRKTITLNWTYPMSAARAGKQGKVLAIFSIERGGDVSYVKILESSGHTILDEAVVTTLKESAPFAPLPENYKEERMNIKGYFNYIL